ncbi:MAG: FmdB family zinc ribbon protein, partial [Actinomycetota bacterium]
MARHERGARERPDEIRHGHQRQDPSHCAIVSHAGRPCPSGAGPGTISTLPWRVPEPFRIRGPARADGGPMPTYRYRCAKCGEELEIWQSFEDKALTRHAGGCGGKLAKVLSPAGIVLKGSGFYKT